MKDDVHVLVRWTVGPPVTVYHYAEKPCRRVTGKGRSRGSFSALLEGEAKARGLERCSACWW
jgi:hypothetical protein